MQPQSEIHSIIHDAIYENFKLNCLDTRVKSDTTLLNHINSYNELGLTPLQYAIHLCSPVNFELQKDNVLIFLNDLLLFLNTIKTFEPYKRSLDGQTALTMAQNSNLFEFSENFMLLFLPREESVELTVFNPYLPSMQHHEPGQRVPDADDVYGYAYDPGDEHKAFRARVPTVNHK